MINTKELLFKKTRLPSKDDPSIVIHHSEEHNILYKKEEQRGVIFMDKNQYDLKTKSLNISSLDKSNFFYRIYLL